MEETKYRGSRLCRLLGNPVVYQLVSLLGNNGPLTPSKLAKFVGRSVQTVSGLLARLRAADLVRYDTTGREVRYWLKHKRETQELLKVLEKVVYLRQARLIPSFRRFGSSRNVEVSNERACQSNLSCFDFGLIRLG